MALLPQGGLCPHAEVAQVSVLFAVWPSHGEVWLRMAARPQGTPASPSSRLGGWAGPQVGSLRRGRVPAEPGAPQPGETHLAAGRDLVKPGLSWFVVFAARTPLRRVGRLGQAWPAAPTCACMCCQAAGPGPGGPRGEERAKPGWPPRRDLEGPAPGLPEARQPWAEAQEGPGRSGPRCLLWSSRGPRAASPRTRGPSRPSHLPCGLVLTAAARGHGTRCSPRAEPRRWG